MSQDDTEDRSGPALGPDAASGCLSCGVEHLEMSSQGSVLAVGKCLACLEFMLFPVWRGIGATGGVAAAWSQGWGRCLRWEPAAAARDGAQIPVSEYPVWLLLCRGGHARIREVCQRGRGAMRLPSHLLSIKPPQLLDVDQVPEVFWEDGIISGYRHPQSSALDCLLSSFHMTNETVNIWTHFLPTCLSFLSDSYTWPLLVYMLLICIYPFTSSLAHTFSTMSPESRHICYFFDYGALSLYSLGCAISYCYYVMPDCWVNTWLHQHFVLIAVGNSLLCTSLSCYSRFLEVQFPKRSKVVRTAAFVIPFIFDTAPLFYRILLCCGGNCGSGEALSNHCYHLLFAFLTCFLFTSHLPERLAPGRFDYFGHSHQLFHISAVVGTHFQMQGVIADMSSRRSWLLAHGVAPSLLGTVGAVTVSLLLNLGIIGIFSAPLLWKSCCSSASDSKEQ
ncbi:membrane progestin receptor delta isoform X2 [Synchiropus splendidus]|uniref:membrane progestin receptor delta isoform X2 n=1 Tax=Synchiropus splendidus TaxID=270530 RepID=UPI00237DFA35|nr:membrane progestin receptor delta isoform X2 [Synchiropus splendidus]